jgi:putative ABC transport system permease protein
MSILYLAAREIGHRGLNFIFSLLAVVFAVGSVTAVSVMLQAHDRQTRAILAAKEADLETRVTKINSDMRKAMSRLGFNIVILPKDQNLGDWYAEDYASTYMPAETVDKLAGSHLKTIEHLMPCLHQRIKWPETKWTVLLHGRGGGITHPSLHIDDMPVESIPQGMVCLGHEIHWALGYKPKDRLVLMNRGFRVYKCYPERGNKDDITIWLELQDAQDLLDKRGLINEIRALEAPGSWSDIAGIRREIVRILPNTQVIELSDLASAKTAARTKATEEGEAALQRERVHRRELKAHRTRLALMLVSLVLLICVGWLSLLAFRNVQDRKVEIGILASLGYTSAQILRLFLLRASALALVGGCLGFLSARLFGALDYHMLGPALLVSVLVTATATCGPALRASQQDPADILCYD